LFSKNKKTIKIGDDVESNNETQETNSNTSSQFIRFASSATP